MASFGIASSCPSSERGPYPGGPPFRHVAGAVVGADAGQAPSAEEGAAWLIAT